MSIEQTLYTTLTNDAGVSALIGTKVYPSLAPESVSNPVISYNLVSGVPISTIPGTGNAVRKRIQINCHADTYAEAKALAAAVIAALEGDGYQEMEYDIYDPTSQVHTVIVDWGFFQT